ncbi:hypothetical protein SNEBB_007873 [Seison nebaliae]|nr:hypothetical protein SNEBB_007873 [Seison nebaliae]
MFRNFQPLTREHCIRTILAGDINTGKRTLINGFIDGGYPCSAGCMCDIVIKQLYANQRKIQVEVYRSLKHDGGLSQLDNSFLRGGDCYALICDLTDAQTISSLPSWRTKCLEKFDPERPVATPFILLANKIDIIRDNNTKIRDFEKGKVLPLWFYNLPKEYETQKFFFQFLFSS